MKKLTRVLLFWFVGFVVVASLWGEMATPPLLNDDFLKRIEDEVSGSIYFEHPLSEYPSPNLGFARLPQGGQVFRG